MKYIYNLIRGILSFSHGGMMKMDSWVMVRKVLIERRFSISLRA